MESIFALNHKIHNMLSLVVAVLFSILPPKWHTDFKEAQSLARSEHKLILLNFSGSDWCGPCMLLRKEYFENPAFESVANEKLILLNADFPRRKKNQLPADQVSRNEALAERYNPQGHFPFTLLLDAEGKVLRTWEGKPTQDVVAWTNELRSACTAQAQK